MSKLIERQTIVTWYTPDERMPKEDYFAVASVSAKLGQITYDHALVIASWADDGDGWLFDNSLLNMYNNEVTVHAWCDLEPYGGGK